MLVSVITWSERERERDLDLTPSYGNVKTGVFIFLQVSKVHVDELHQHMSIKGQPEGACHQRVHKEGDEQFALPMLQDI